MKNLIHNNKFEYKVLICDDNEYYIQRLSNAISRINYKNKSYSLSITLSVSPEDFIKNIQNYTFDIIILDVCLRDTVDQATYSDYLRSHLITHYYGNDLYHYVQKHCPEAFVFALSNLPINVIRAEFNNSDLQYFCKTDTSPEKISSYIKNYFDTKRKSILNNIFVVYVHNKNMLDNVNKFIKQLGLNSVDLMEYSPGGIRTIFDALNTCANSIECAIVLLSGDDIVCNTHTMTMTYRARQNVIFEMGLFSGFLGRDKVIVLYEPHEKFEFPSDIVGIFYHKYDNNNEWKKSVKSDLKKVGFNIN